MKLTSRAPSCSIFWPAAASNGGSLFGSIHPPLPAGAFSSRAGGRAGSRALRCPGNCAWG
eukprot:3318768-Pyramimonas_sp.AAC.1